jgi:hypothetical protein
MSRIEVVGAVVVLSTGELHLHPYLGGRRLPPHYIRVAPSGEATRLMQHFLTVSPTRAICIYAASPDEAERSVPRVVARLTKASTRA